MTLLREALTRGESYERELLQAIEARLRSPEDYARYQMLLAEPLVRRMRPYLPEGQVRILEVGCGTGGISVYLASQGYRVSAVDREQYDPEALRATRDYSRAQGIALNVYLADAAELPFATGTFEAVVCSNVVEHLDDPQAALAEMHRVLVPGGVAFVDFPLFRGPYGGHIEDAIKLPWFHLLPRAWVEKELRRRGAEKDRTVFATLNRITNARFRRLLETEGFETLQFRRGHYLTHPGRKLIVSLLESVRASSGMQALRAIRAAARDFSAAQLCQFPLLLLAVPISYLPGLGEFFASGVKYVMRKPVQFPGSAGAATA
jgi:ubiquinone/menaquinone biosynthesis C-methylase UbiE